MNTFKLKNLAREIVSKKGIKRSSAKKIQSLLPSNELTKLAEYISVEQEKKTVRVIVADSLPATTSKSISGMFGGKRVITTVDRAIGAGVKVQVYDMIYDLTIKTKINNIVQRLGEEI